MDVLIRAAEARDFPRLTAIFDHPDVVIHSSQHPFLGEAKVTALLRDREDLVLLVAECEGEVQGYIGITLNTKPRAKHVASLGMAVHPDTHGKGIGSRLLQEAIALADDYLNIVRLELSVYEDNAPGLGLYKKFGFEHEGTARYALFKAGKYMGLHHMARIHPNVEAQCKQP